MPITLTMPEILNAATTIAVAEIKRREELLVREALFEACEGLIDAGLIPIDTAPDVWRCCEQNKLNTIESLRSYLERQ